MKYALRPLAIASAAFLTMPAASAAPQKDSALLFFEGETERLSVVKVVMKKPYRSRTICRGRILPDGSLSLVQETFEPGKPPKIRQWKIWKVSANRYSGSMSEALGPVQVDHLAGKYRFRLKVKGNLAVEEWLVPAADGQTARTQMTVHKWGMKVASSEGTIRRLHPPPAG